MAKPNYSAGKRQRERDKAQRKKAKQERQRDKTDGTSGIPIATVDEIQGGMKSIDEVMRAIVEEPDSPEASRRPGMPCRLFVAGLTRSITNEELRARFEAFGPVTDVFVPLDADTGDPRGFGFVTMADSKDASRAISKLDGEEIDGRNMVVRIATDRR